MSKDFLEVIKKITDKDGDILVDNIHFRAKDGSFDPHRIFKLPSSVDMSTGIIVKTNFEQLQFKEKIEELR